ncbi:hypothetical protein HPB48_003079 [Haemaphysalis longicornis]|uniref:Uncharacterized protein n=1 Tax=Haemaphysalis longicornis TaxID=44386 RepID=A0A9J6FRE0_HAELO|nr:hypothetical protein HPB48_003079 [Haemaphysalis longicornis]
MMNLKRQLMNTTQYTFFGSKAKQALQDIRGCDKIKMEFLNMYDRALTFLDKCFDFENSPLKKLAELELCKGAPVISAVAKGG